MFTPFASTAARRLAARIALCAAMVVALDSSAFAQGPRGGRQGMPHGAMVEARGARQAERAQQRAARGGPQREAPQREAPQRTVEPPMQSMPPPAAPQEAAPTGRPGRLTPDERRALRQQINEAGRDVYRPNRP